MLTSNQSVYPRTYKNRLQFASKSLTLPIACLAFCGTLLGIGVGFSQPQLQIAFPALSSPILVRFFDFLKIFSGVVINHLPLLFSLSIPLGMATRASGEAAFSGLLAYLMHLSGAQFMLSLLLYWKQVRFLTEPVLGIETVSSGVLGGVFIGFIILRLYEAYPGLRLWSGGAFLSGFRMLPILSMLIGFGFGLALPIVWPLISFALYLLGMLVEHMGLLAPFLFGTIEALLRPFGLHHLWVQLFTMTAIGGCAEINGQFVEGALNLFYAQAQLPSLSPTFLENTTQFLSQGKMPSYMGGLPGAALAMYHLADKENRKKTRALLWSGVAASVLGGFTEPLEVLFLNVAPALYVIHSCLVGLGFLMMKYLHVTIGNTEGNLIDFLVWGILQGTKTNWMKALMGIGIWFVLYYALFGWIIYAWALNTPGRNSLPQTPPALSPQRIREQVFALIESLGGKENISTLDNCLTRLRVSVLDITLLRPEKLKQAGAFGMVQLDTHNLQIVLGPQVESIKEALVLELRKY